MLGVVAVVVDGRHVPDAALRHLGDGFVVHVGRMFDGIGAGSHRIARARGSVAVDRDGATERVGRFDGGLHLFVGERLVLADVLEAAGRSKQLDPVDAGADLLADTSCNFCGAVCGPGARQRPCTVRLSCDAEAVADDKHPRSGEDAHAHQIAHRHIGVLRRVQAPHGRDAGFERLLEIRLGEDHRDGRQAVAAARPCPGRAVPVVGHVRVHIDETWDDRESAQVDLFRSGWRRAGANRHNPIVLDDHERMGDLFTCGIDQFARADRLGRCRGGCGDQRRYQTDRDRIHMDLPCFLGVIIYWRWGPTPTAN